MADPDTEPLPPPWVNVTLQGPDDGGDFGPLTPGTRTGGIQEALDYAHAHGRDLYLHGGCGGLHRGEGRPHNIYTLEETLRIPWSQDFTLGGGNYLLNYTPRTGHAVHLDSQMNCRIKLGLVLSGSPDAAVCLRPLTPGPDDFVVITTTLFDFSAVIARHPEGTAILLDSARGPIVNCKITAEEFNATGTGVHLSDASGEGQWISNNHIQIFYGNQYHATGPCTGLLLGDPGSRKIVHNRLELSFHAPRGAFFDDKEKRYKTREDFIAKNAVGARIHAQHNALILSCFGPRPAGHDVIFEKDARDNTLFTLNLPNGVTNNALVPTNKITANSPVGFSVETPPVPPSDQYLTNTCSRSVQVFILDPGQVAEWTLCDAGAPPPGLPHNLSLVDNLRGPQRPLPPPSPAQSQSIPGPLHPGQTFVLEPGERIKFRYSSPPAWRWKALRC